MADSGFETAEYDRRWAGLIERLDHFGVDVLAVTSAPHLRYLTGYDGEGAYAAPFVLIVAPGAPRTFVVRAYDESAVRAQSIPVEIVTYFGRGDAIEVWAESLRSLGLSRGRLGLELDCWGLAPLDVQRLREQLSGLTIVDASRLVPSVGEIKSPVEIEAMRRAMRYTEVAVETFSASLRVGVSELEVASAIEDAVHAEGGDAPDCYLLFGPRSALPHGRASAYRIGAGDVAFIEVAGRELGYAAALTRTAIVGRHGDAESLHAVAEAATRAAIDALTPGSTAGMVDEAARSVVERAGRGSTFLQRAGYSIGIDWYARGAMSLEPGATDVLKPGMTFHLPRILFDEAGRFGVGTSETVLVTEAGPEVLSTSSRELRLVAVT